MSRLARSVQYPVPCHECGANTAHTLDNLINTKKITCRHCNHLFNIDGQLKRRVNRALTDLADYISLPEPAEEKTTTEDNTNA